jgi:hypothetical protein
MEIKNERPPIWDSACATFEITPKTIFTYGNAIYNPFEINITEDLIAHETIHAAQQGGNDKDAALWWGKYLREPSFRLDQESKAYAAQYKYFCTVYKDRNKRMRILFDLARTLCGPLYGQCSSHLNAVSLIKRHAKLGSV